MAGGGPGKFIGFFRLVDACGQPGCPVCRCLVADARQYLERLLYEQVTDPVVRRQLYASWGFCNWHAWLVRETPDPAFGSAILSDDLLRLAIQRFDRLPRARGKRRESRQIACVTLQRVAGEAALHAQMIEIGLYDRRETSHSRALMTNGHASRL